MNREAETDRRGAADWLVLVGRFAALVYLNVLVWLSAWVLIPTMFMGYQPMAIDSGSMGPSINAGDVVLVRPYAGEPIEAGRVITFEDPAEPGRLVTHRVTAAEPDGTYRTKGDANADADSTPLAPEQIRGVGRLVVPRVGIPVVWLTQGRYVPLGAWTVSVVLALVLLTPSKPAGPPAPAEASPARVGRFRRADTAASGGGPVGSRRGIPSPPAFADRPVPQSAAPPAVFSLPLPPVAPPSFTQVLPAPPAAPVSYPVVPAVRYRLRLPRPPAALALPAPPQWTVSMVPPAPGTAPIAPIPAPPRPGAVRRGSALSSRDVPGWAGRLHSVALVLAMVAGLAALGAAAPSPASAAFSSTHHRIVENTANSFTADQLSAPTNPSITAPLAACRLTVGWNSSTSTWRDGYRIYRAVNGGAYSLLVTAAYDAIGYIDNTANNSSNTYSYKMVAYKAVTWESAATAPVSASPSFAACTA